MWWRWNGYIGSPITTFHGSMSNMARRAREGERQANAAHCAAEVGDQGGKIVIAGCFDSYAEGEAAQGVVFDVVPRGGQPV